MSQKEIIGRYTSHIPAKYFKMMRDYGFLANRKQGELLPKVYEALQIEVRKKSEQTGFSAMMKDSLCTDTSCAVTDSALSMLRLIGTSRN